MVTDLISKARQIRLVVTDVDGVLTDTGVYYSAGGEEMKRFSIRDGMGVERLRQHGIEVAIVTGENSESVRRRAEKLNIRELHLGVSEKKTVLVTLSSRKNIPLDDIAYIGDDTNDLGAMAIAGLTACPADATEFASRAAHLVTRARGGHGAFREFAEYIIAAKQSSQTGGHDEK